MFEFFYWILLSGTTNYTDLRLKNIFENILLLMHFCVLKYKITLTVAYHVPFLYKIKFSYCINMYSLNRMQI
jgi:hypothetical protein